MQSCTICKTVLSLRVLLICVLLFLSQLARIEAAPLHASPCTLAWNNSPDPTVAGYALYYGTSRSGTTNRLDAGMTNVVTLYNLTAFTNYFFFVVAYSTGEVESLPSSVAYYSPPVFSRVKCTLLANGSASLSFSTATGAVCHVEYTPTLNPAQWQTLSNATADAKGNVTLTDPLAGRPPTRFYRTAMP